MVENTFHTGRRNCELPGKVSENTMTDRIR
jgi:hypothetical protein